MNARSPSTYPSSFHQSPNMSSPAISTPTASHPQVSSPPGGTSFSSTHTAGPSTQQIRQRPSLSGSSYSASSTGQSATTPSEDMHTSQNSPMYGNYPQATQNYNVHNQTNQGPSLPPFSSISTMGPPISQQGNVSSVRYQSSDAAYSRTSAYAGSKRQAPPSSNVTSADSSDFDDDDGGDLPAHGLVAPWEVLRGLADVASERAAKVTYLLSFLDFTSRLI